jgi:hypothetical protein
LPSSCWPLQTNILYILFPEESIRPHSYSQSIRPHASPEGAEKLGVAVQDGSTQKPVISHFPL